MKIACIWNSHNMFKKKKYPSFYLFYFLLEVEALLMVQNTNEYCVTKRISLLIVVVNKYLCIVRQLQRFQGKSKETPLQ